MSHVVIPGLRANAWAVNATELPPEEAIAATFREIFDELLGGKLPLRPDLTQEWVDGVGRRFRQTLALYGDESLVYVDTLLDAWNHHLTVRFFEASSGRELREPRDIVAVLRNGCHQ